MIDKFLPSVIKGIGGLASYFMSEAAIQRQNRYNLPKNQIQRLREAGIPLVAAKYFDNTQKSLPDTSGIQYASEGLSSYIHTEKELKEIENLKNSIRKLGAEADIAENLKQLSDEDIKYWIDNGVNLKNFTGNNYQYKKFLEMGIVEANHMIAGHEQKIKEIDKNVAVATEANQIKEAAEKVTDIIQSWKLKRNVRLNNEQMQSAAHAIIQHMKKGGLSFWEAIIMNTLLSFGAKIQAPGIQIGGQ